MKTYGERAVTCLHDVLEDSDVLLEDLGAFFPPFVIADVDALTRRNDETYFEYIERVSKSSETARLVRIADLEDHLDHREHIPESLVRRYTKALAILRA